MAYDPYKPGDIVQGRYEVEEMIGSGGFARVYRAVEQGLERNVALKVLSPEDDHGFSDFEIVKKRFNREARLVSQLTSPQTITLHEFDTLPDGRLFMALEYVDGVTISDQLEEGGISADRVRDIVVQILDALGEAHAAGVLHRDIKPSNIMLFDRFGRSDCVKLLDFGIAKKLATEEARDENLTSDGTLVGTPRYMSPEQLKRYPLGPASDLYSVGLIAHELWTGRPVLQSNDVTDIFRKIRASTDMATGMEDAPELLRRVTRRLLRVDPEDRYRSAERVLEDLEDSEERGANTEQRLSDAASGFEPTFPVGLDRTVETPSSELTGVEAAGGGLTAEARAELTSASNTTDPPAGTVPPLQNERVGREEPRRPRLREMPPQESGPSKPERSVAEKDVSESELSSGWGETSSRPVVLAVGLGLVGLLGVTAFIVGPWTSSKTPRQKPSTTANSSPAEAGTPVRRAATLAASSVETAVFRAAARARKRSSTFRDEDPSGDASSTAGSEKGPHETEAADHPPTTGENTSAAPEGFRDRPPPSGSAPSTPSDQSERDESTGPQPSSDDSDDEFGIEVQPLE